ncbi:MAG: flavin reductase family protein [Bacteroidota bacterium]
MSSKIAFGPQKILFPMPVSLVVTGTMEKSNIVTIAWVSLLTSAPPTLGISVGSKGYTADRIIANGHFTVNIASADIMKQADFCGITSGRDTDKFKVTGLTRLASKHIASPIIKECPLNIECELTEHAKVGHTWHFVGKILDIHMDSDKLTDKENPGSYITELMNPLVYMGGAREYRTLGQKIGDAYQIGKDLKK